MMEQVEVVVKVEVVVVPVVVLVVVDVVAGGRGGVPLINSTYT